MQQLIGFDTTKGGHTPNFCLANVCAGYSIKNLYPSAWEAWSHTQQHTDTPPAGTDVPVFFSYTATIDNINKNWGHIGVKLKDGRFWSDGNIYPSIESYQANHTPRYVGWGESINNVTILKGDDMSTVGEVEFNDLYRAFFGSMTVNPPTQDDRKRWIGAETNTVIRAMEADPRHAAYLSYVSDLQKPQQAYNAVTEQLYRKV
jgi:hypothetical protein